MNPNSEALVSPRIEPAAKAADQPSMSALLQTGYGSTDVFRLGRSQRPQAGEGEVVVRVHAAGLDRGTWHLMSGRPYLMRIMGFGFSAPKNPVPGMDLAGTVVEIGSNVTRFKVGDAVFGYGQGSFAEYCAARADKLSSKPAALSFEQAAVLGVSGSTALQALRDAGRVERGQRVLVIGASGGVGSYAVQLAKTFGAEVAGVCSTAKVDAVRSLGADHVIDYTQHDFADGARQYELILDIAGNSELARLRRALTPTGRLVFVGGENGGDYTAGFERQLLAFALAPFVRQRFAMLMTREHFTSLDELAELAQQGQIAPFITRRCSLAAVPDALRELEAGRIAGKVVVSIDAEAGAQS